VLAAYRPGRIVPPPSGTLCRIVTIPPDSDWQGKAGSAEVAAYFASVGAPEASTYSNQAGHPYMQKTSTLDFCMVLSGEPQLVLDDGEVKLNAGQVAVIRGSNHAWSNPGTEPVVLAVTSHDGRA
jgi:uncharacterized cupin superfamily protein